MKLAVAWTVLDLDPALFNRTSDRGPFAVGLAGPEPVGDIVIGLQTARRQAAERGVTASDELELLAAHGLLHLFGYDHMFPAEAEEMARQERMLLGRSIINEATGEG